MDGTTKRCIGFGALTGLLIAGVIGVNAMNVSGQALNPAGPYPQSKPYGTLTIGLTERAGSLTLALTDGTVFTQAIRTTQPCATIVLEPIRIQNDPTPNPYPGQTLLDVRALVGSPLAPGGSVQIPSTLLGVESGTNCGTPSGQLGPNEALTISLGTFADFTTESVSAQSGTLVIGKTNTQDKKLKLAYDAGTFGADIDIAVGGTSVPTGSFTDSITLRSTATSNSRGLSLKGGTVFNLVAATDGAYENAVQCDQTVTEEGGDGEVAKSAEFYRAYDNKGEATCTDEVGVTVDITEDVVSWDNGTIGVNGTVQYVAGLMTIEWAPIDPSQPAADIQEVLAREIDYDGANTGAGFEAVQWCASKVELPPIGDIRVFDVDMGDVPWCLISDTQVLVGGEIIQTQEYYGQGDPQAR